MRILPIVLAITVLLAGCPTKSPTSPITSIPKAASAAKKRGDWAAAAQLWEEAIQKENGFWKPEFSRSPQRLAIFYYELGRSRGVIGQYDEADKHLLQALRLDEKFNG